MTVSKKRIGIYPPEEFSRLQLTFASLEELFPVMFEPFSPESSPRPDACLFLGEHHAVADQLGIPCYVWEKKPVSLTSFPSQVKFSTHTHLHKAIRGQTVVESGCRELSFCSAGDADTVIATVADRPVWVNRGLIHRVSVDLPRLNADDFLYTHFVPKRWLGLLPLIHFLRSVTADIDWQTSPSKACFIIDDPNLHALTYGGLDFRKVACDAKTRKYHVAIATVPMDAWYVNRNVAHLFTDYCDHLSLGVHGSDHTKCELTERDANQLSRLAQALRRVDVLERKVGLDVSRIMVAPHEACSEPTMNLMLKLGYEGMAIKLSKLLYWVRDKHWRRDLGLTNVLWMGCGFPIIHRFRLRDCATQTRLTAFLDRPVVPYGHPYDCSLDLLGSVADAINGFDGHWADLKSIMRSNYKTKIAGDLLHIQMCSRYIKLTIPNHIRRISVERPWMEEGDIESLVCKTAKDNSRTVLAGPISDMVEVAPGSEISIQALPKEYVDYRALIVPPVRAWSMVRRVLVETRDRLKPVVLSTVKEAEIDPA